MPTGNQNVLENEFPNYGKTGIHSRSNQERLASAFPDSPVHDPYVTSSTIREYYFNEVLSGEYDPDSDFTQSNYDYSEAPEIPNTTAPDGESSPGNPGSTIVSSGKGPNVATLNRNNLQTNASPMVEIENASEPPFSGLGSGEDPSETSSRISSQNFVTGLPMGKSSE